MRINVNWIIVAAFGQFILGLWAEHGSEPVFKKYLEPVFGFPISAYWIILFAALLYVYLSNRTTETSQRHEQQVAELERKLSEKATAIIASYDELKTYRAYEKLNLVLDNFVKRHRHVMGVQLYEYSEDEIDDVKYTVRYVTGQVTAEVPLNAVAQIYYSVPYDLYRHFEEAVSQHQEVEFVQDCEAGLSTLTAEGVASEHCITFALMILATESYMVKAKERAVSLFEAELEQAQEFDEAEKAQILQSYRRELESELKFKEYLDDEELENELHDLIRTGLLRGILSEKILHETSYMFSNNGSNEKKERYYLVKNVAIQEDRNQLFLLTVSPKIKRMDNWSEAITELGNELEKSLRKNGLIE